MLRDAEEWMIRCRMRYTGDSEEICRAIVDRVRAKAVYVSVTPESHRFADIRYNRKRNKARRAAAA